MLAWDGRKIPYLGAVPDEMQSGVDWVDLASLSGCRMYPRAVARILAGGVPEGGPRRLMLRDRCSLISTGR